MATSEEGCLFLGVGTINLMVAPGGLEPPPAPSEGVYGFRVR